jgi:hypothetical protein
MGRMGQIGPMGVWDGVGAKRVYVPYSHPSHLSHICLIGPKLPRSLFAHRRRIQLINDIPNCRCIQPVAREIDGGLALEITFVPQCL